MLVEILQDHQSAFQSGDAIALAAGIIEQLGLGHGDCDQGYVIKRDLISVSRRQPGCKLCRQLFLAKRTEPVSHPDYSVDNAGRLRDIRYRGPSVCGELINQGRTKGNPGMYLVKRSSWAVPLLSLVYAAVGRPPISTCRRCGCR